MSDLEKFRKHYASLATLELARLAKDFADMREDVLPILFEELEKRGETQLVDSIRLKINPNDVEAKERMDGLGLTVNPISETTYDDELAENPEILDADTYKRLFTHTQTEIMSLAYSKVLKEKDKLANWESVKKMIHDKWDFTDRQFTELCYKLNKKRKRANSFIAFVVILVVACLIAMVASEGQIIAAPGLLVIIIGFNSYGTSKHLGRILKSTDELDNII